MAQLKNANWLSELPWIMLEIRTAPKKDLKAFSANMVYGSTPLASLFPLMTESQQLVSVGENSGFWRGVR